MLSDVGEYVRKIDVRCECGKKYRAREDKAGSAFLCAKCDELVRIPEPDSLTSHDRRGILEELGIDHESARSEWEAERARDRRCFYCASRLEDHESPGATGSEALCVTCQVSQVELRVNAAEEILESEESRSGIKLRDTDLGLRKAAGYFAFFFVGHAGLANVFGSPLWFTVLFAVVVSLVGAHLVYSSTSRKGVYA